MKIIIAGDYAPIRRTESLLINKRYDEIFDEGVKNVISSADYSIVNFESPVYKQDSKGIQKCGPHLKTVPEAVEAIKYAGFNCATLANNHYLDYGQESAQYTIQLLNSNSIDYVGGGHNIDEASKTLTKVIDGCSLSIINCCEHEFSIATESLSGSNPINPIAQYHAIQEAKKHSDFVLVIVHGGLEGCQLPLLRMQETYRFFIDAGADAVINHHQHCFSGYETYKNKPICYGLGNFIFDPLLLPKTNQSWHEGILAQIIFSKDEIPRLELIPYTQCLDIPGVRISEDELKDKILGEVSRLSHIIADNQKLKSAVYEHIDNNCPWHRIMFEPWGRGFRVLHYKGYLPSAISKSKWLALTDYFLCETHMDCIRRIFEKKVNEF